MTDKLSRGIINNLDSNAIILQQICMFSICFAAFTFIMTSSISSMPISGTHAVVGGVLGAGIEITSASKLNFQSLIGIVISWFSSPLLAMLISLMLMTLVSLLTLRTGK